MLSSTYLGSDDPKSEEVVEETTTAEEEVDSKEEDESVTEQPSHENPEPHLAVPEVEDVNVQPDVMAQADQEGLRDESAHTHEKSEGEEGAFEETVHHYVDASKDFVSGQLSRICKKFNFSQQFGFDRREKS